MSNTITKDKADLEEAHHVNQNLLKRVKEYLKSDESISPRDLSHNNRKKIAQIILRRLVYAIESVKILQHDIEELRRYVPLHNLKRYLSSLKANEKSIKERLKHYRDYWKHIKDTGNLARFGISDLIGKGFAPYNRAPILKTLRQMYDIEEHNHDEFIELLDELYTKTQYKKVK